MVGVMRVEKSVERISPDGPSEHDGRISRVAQSLNFIVTPLMMEMAQATKSKRARP